jgi:two-component system, chemotaxis family, CheB/CheR fusion protein
MVIPNTDPNPNTLNNRELHTKELEELIDQRTRELKSANEELVRKNDDLVKMNMELEAFAYVSSHDLQEPLRKIQTFAGRVIDREFNSLSEKSRIYLQLMQDAANRMQQLIDDLLTFSKLTTSQRKFESVDLNLLIKEVENNLKDTILEKNAIIKTGAISIVHVVVFQFRQLMHNLISNALKFSRPDVSPVIRIESEIVDGKNVPDAGISYHKKYCHITVSDNGIGFENQYREKIFEVFQKLHGKDKFPGTGIGLATVKKIVANHNGLISASGELNKGARFDIFIPSL